LDYPTCLPETGKFLGLEGGNQKSFKEEGMDVRHFSDTTTSSSLITEIK
jgi:hypothetical protein